MLAATVTATGVGLVALAGAPGPSAAAPQAVVADPCAQAFPQTSLVPGQTVEGQTVSSGTVPEAFTGTYLETLEDGIAPGVDMIMMELHSPAIDKAGGIWAGMSGSPVYDPATGQLIGAVAYGLGTWGPTPIAGITPAAHMRALLAGAPGGGKATVDATLSPRVQQRLVAKGTLSKAQAGAGITELGIPLTVSGVSQRRINQLHYLFGGRDVYRAGGAGAVADQSIPVDTPGDNLAASYSSGAMSFAGIGTATLVCGNEVVGFGHPFDFTGKSTLGMHGASALFVQEDPAGTPYKVANPGAVVGMVDQDRWTGIHAETGPPPASAEIHSTATSPDTPGTTQGTTNVYVPDVFPDVAFYHLFTLNDKALDRIGAGSAKADWTVTGKHRNGTPFSYSDRDVYVDSYDISFAPVGDILEQLFLLQENGQEKVTFDKVEVHTSFADDATEWSIGRIYYRSHGAWKRITGKSYPKVQPGTTFNVRLELYSRTADTKYRVVPVTIAKKAAHERSAWVTITGGNWGFDSEEFEDWFDEGFGGSLPKSVNEQIKQFKNRQKNNELRTVVRAPKAGRRTTDKVYPEVVNGEVFFRVRVR